MFKLSNNQENTAMSKLNKFLTTTIATVLIIGGGTAAYTYMNGGLPEIPGITSDAKANAELSEENAIASAKLVPPSTFVATYINANSGKIATPKAQKFLAAGLQNLNKNFSEGDKINYENDLKSWVDGVMIALLPTTNKAQSLQKANTLMVVVIKDDYKSEVDELSKKLEEGGKATINSIDYNNQEIKEIKGKGNPEYITLLDDKYLLFSSSKSAIEQAIDTSKEAEKTEFLSKIGTPETIASKIQLESTQATVFIPDYQSLVDNFIANNPTIPSPTLEKLNNFRQVKSVIASIGGDDDKLRVKANANLDPKIVKSESAKTTAKEFSQFPTYTIALISSQGQTEWWQSLNKEVPELNSIVREANQELTSASMDLSFSIEPLLAEANQ